MNGLIPMIRNTFFSKLALCSLSVYLIILPDFLSNLPGHVWAQEVAAHVSQEAADLQVLDTRQIDLEQCIPLYVNSKQLVIRDKATLDSLVRKDASFERCDEYLKDLDFDKHTLIGIELNSGWCRVPRGLAFETFDDKAKQRYVFAVSFEAPVEPCRALSRYDLWVLVPKLPRGYSVAFEVGPKFPEE